MGEDKGIVWTMRICDELMLNVLYCRYTNCIMFFYYSERERDKDRGERDKERGERRRRSRSRDRERHRRHRSRSREGRKRSRSKSPKNKSRRRKPSLYWDVPPPGFEHIAPLQYKAMQGKILRYSITKLNTYR